MIEPYYQDNYCTIYNCDCREILPELTKADLVLTDPPYGIGESKGKNSSRSKLAKPKDYGVKDWDKKTIDFIDKIISSGKRACIFGGNYYNVPPSSCWFVWDKDNTGDFADCELIWTNLKQAVRKIKYRWNGMLQEPGKPKETRYHPTQKPLHVIKWIISQADKHGDNNLILDPFMGSGTILRASKDLGRKSIGIEKDEEYCEIAAKRLAQEVLLF